LGARARRRLKENRRRLGAGYFFLVFFSRQTERTDEQSKYKNIPEIFNRRLPSMSRVGVSTRTVHPLLNRHYSMTTKQQSDNSINEEVEEEVCDNTRERRREIIEAKVERRSAV
jgi:hypothetical protein